MSVDLAIRIVAALVVMLLVYTYALRRGFRRGHRQGYSEGFRKGWMVTGNIAVDFVEVLRFRARDPLYRHDIPDPKELAASLNQIIIP
jgi:hypothetical protein